MVVVQNTNAVTTSSENIKTTDLKPHQSEKNDPYITAYFKADMLPLTFIIGDGEKRRNFSNQPLKQNSSYAVFLRFFESEVNTCPVLSLHFSTS